MAKKPGEEVWFVIHSEDLKKLLDRAWTGEDPDILILEVYGNCAVRKVDGDGEWVDTTGQS